VVLLLSVAMFRLRHREPEYDGKALHLWLEQIGENPRRTDAAITAVRAIGTNAIPWLLAALAVASAVQYGSISVSDAEVLVPVLTGLLKSTNAATRSKAKNALGHFRDKAAGQSLDLGR